MCVIEHLIRTVFEQPFLLLYLYTCSWMGSWRNQTLSSLIDLLNDEFGFTCYWPGIHNSIWRITGCWLDHYNLHFWSNVACVNRNAKEVKGIAEQMETMFYETLDKGDEYLMTWENRKKHRRWRQGKEYVEQSQSRTQKQKRKEQREKRVMSATE